ncbi:GNAT family N-acetyltransferase [Microbacterium sp.]|uniref:GNAT family N-acetyltransferase n=1 Tax=Microbacterium sp. TaxID=51671 RepID=UPI002811BEAA|nr:GNAT family protein [Microbacterium sp.]
MTLLGDGVRLRPVQEGDAARLAAAYTANRDHLAAWEPERSADFYTSAAQAEHIRVALRERAEGRALRLVLTKGERIVGRVNITDVVRGAFLSGNLGYWIDARLTGRGVMTRAVAVALDLCSSELALHRVQASTLVHNVASQRVHEANRFERIGLAPQYLRIAGRWQDHLLFQRILTDD